MVTLTNPEINEALEIVEKTEKYLCGLGDSIGRNFVRGTLREYRFHLFFNRMGVYATDLDFVVQDADGAICCLIEVKEMGRGWLSDRHAKVYLQIAEALKIPFYFIRYAKDFSHFKIIEMASSNTGVTRTKISNEVIDTEALRGFLQAQVDGEPPAPESTTPLEELF